MIRKQNRQYKNYIKNGCKAEDQIRVERFRNECFEATNKAKDEYLKNMGTKLSNSQSSSKTYWKILKRLINKSHVPRIPPILYINKLIVSCKEKASLFNEYFLSQCTPIGNNSVLPDLIEYTTESKLCTISFVKEDLLSMIRSLNPNKSHIQYNTIQFFTAGSATGRLNGVSD